MSGAAKRSRRQVRKVLEEQGLLPSKLLRPRPWWLPRRLWVRLLKRLMVAPDRVLADVVGRG